MSPRLRYDTAGTIAEAKRLWARVGRPNLMIKIPGTPEGLPAVEESASTWGSTSTSRCSSPSRSTRPSLWTYIRALERRAAEGQPIQRLALGGQLLREPDRHRARPSGGSERSGGPRAIPSWRRSSSPSKARRRSPTPSGPMSGSRHLRRPALPGAGGGGARQRPLWASTSTKNPKYSDVLYVETLAGPDPSTRCPRHAGRVPGSRHGQRRGCAIWRRRTARSRGRSPRWRWTWTAFARACWPRRRDGRSRPR